VFATDTATSKVLTLNLPEYKQAGTINYSASWADKSTVKIGAVPSTTDGTVYYMVREATDSAPTAAEVLTSGSTFDATTSGASVLQSVSSTNAKKIYLVFTDGTNIYQMSTMDLPKYGTTDASSSNSTTTGSVQFSAERTDASTIKLSITPTVKGTAYYKIQDATDDAPDSSEQAVKDGWTAVSVSDLSNLPVTVTKTDQSSSAKKIYVRYATEDGTFFDGPTVLELPAYDETSGPAFKVQPYYANLGSRTLFYGADRPDAQTITIENTGTENLTFSLSSTPCHTSTGSDLRTSDIQWYELSDGVTSKTLAPGETATFTIQPKVGSTGVDINNDVYADYYFYHKEDGSALTATVNITAKTADGQELSLDPMTFSFTLVDTGSYTGWQYKPNTDTTLQLKYYTNGKEDTSKGTISPVYCINLTDPLNKSLDSGATPFMEHDNADSVTFGKIAGEETDGTRTYYGPSGVRTAEDTYNHVKLVLANGYGNADTPSDLLGVTSVSQSTAFYAATQSAIWYFTNYQSADPDGSLDYYLSQMYTDKKTLADTLSSSDKAAIESVFNTLISDNPGTVTDPSLVQADIYENILGQDGNGNVVKNYQNLIHGTVQTTPVFTGQVTVNKVWDNVDEDKRGTLTFKLLRDGEDTGLTLTLDGTADTDTTASAYEDSEWHGVFQNLPTVNLNGDQYNYTVEETTTSDNWELTKTEQITSDVSSDSLQSHTISGNYTADEEHSSYNSVYHDLSVDGEVVYCFDLGKDYPQPGQEYGTKIVNASSEELLAINTKGRSDIDLKAAILKVLYNGYPNDASSLKSKYNLTDEQFRIVTQEAIWNYTESYDDATKGTTKFKDNPDMASAFDDLVGNNTDAGIKEPPAGYGLTIYTTTANGIQALLSATLTQLNEFQFTNSGTTPTTTEFTFTKTWDAQNSTVPSADQFADWLTLYANGTKTATDYKPTITVNSDGTWTVTYKDLPATDSDGNTITYTVKEDAEKAAAAGFTPSSSEAVSNNGSLKNTENNTESTSVGVTKSWDGVPESLRGSVSFKLYRQVNGGVKEYAGLTLTLDGTVDTDATASAYEDSEWHGVFQNLPAVDGNGNAYTYTVEESSTSDNWTLTSAIEPTSDDVSTTNANYPAILLRSVDGTDLIALEDGGQRVVFSLDNEKIIPSYTDSVIYTAKTVGSSNIDSDVVKVIYNGYGADAAGLKAKYSLSDDQLRVVTQLAIWYYTNGIDQSSASGLSENEMSAFEALTGRSSEVNLVSVPDDVSPVVYAPSDPSNRPSLVYAGVTPSSDWTFTNTNTTTTSVSVTKAWVGPEGSSVTVHLLADGSDTGETLTLDAESGWTGTFQGLAKYDRKDGHEIAYTVSEDAIEGYTPAVTGDATDGYTITNTNTTTTSVSVTKAWVGPEGSSVTVHLLADGSDTGETLTLDAESGWTGTFQGLAKYDRKDGHEIAYTVSEDAIEGYTPAVTGDATDGYTITNTNNETIQPVVTKAWDSSVQPKSVTLQLLNGDKVVSEIELDGSPDDGVTADNTKVGEFDEWHGRFASVPKYTADGAVIVYKVREKTTGDWIPATSGNSADGFTVTNGSLGSTSQQMKAQKTFKGGTLQDGEFTFQLFEGTDTTGNLLQTATNAADGTVTFAPISYTNKGTFVYTIVEKNSGTTDVSYDSAVYHATVEVTDNDGDGNLESSLTYIDATSNTVEVPSFTNVLTTRTNVSFTKSWHDDNAEGSKSATIRLLRSTDGGEPADTGISVTVDGETDDQLTTGDNGVLYGEDSAWHGVFNNLVASDGEHTYTYTVSEDAIDGYTSAVTGNATNGYTITNTRTGTTSVSITKTWIDDGANRPTADEFAGWLTLVYSDGTAVQNAPAPTVSGTDTNAWTITYENLPQYDDQGRALSYKIVEDEKKASDAGYAVSTDEQGNLTNTGTTSLSVTKTWVKGDDELPSADTFKGWVKLYITGQGDQDKDVTADYADKLSITEGENNVWTVSYTGLPALKSGSYKITEDATKAADAGYTLVTDASGNMTNKGTKTTSVSITKKWVDGTSTRPSQGEFAGWFKLYANGEEITGYTPTVSGDVDSDTWTVTYSKLPILSEGEYTIKETVPEDAGYTASTTEGISNGGTITNTGTTSVSITKVWQDNDATRPSAEQFVSWLTLKDPQGNAVSAEPQVSDNGDNTWTVTYSNLPALSSGEYTIEEDSDKAAAAGYTVSHDGATITNTGKDRGRTSVSITKTWKDGGDTNRPDAKTFASWLTLEYSDGTAVQNAPTPTITQNGDSWTITYSGLYAEDENGNPITYKIVESETAAKDAGYSVSYGDGAITNTRTGTVQPKVAKTWLAGTTKAQSLTIDLQRLEGGKWIRVDSVVLNDANGWKSTFGEHEKFDSEGKLYSYRVVEQGAEAYVVSTEGDPVNGFTVTNAPLGAAKVSLSATKTVNGAAPAGKTYQFTLSEGEKVLQTVTSDAQNGAVTFGDLVFTEAGPHTYTVKEVVGNDELTTYDRTVYTVKVNVTRAEDSNTLTATTTITNDSQPVDGMTFNNTVNEKISVPVEKKWADGVADESATVELLANGEHTGKTLTLNESNGWKGSFNDLDKVDASGNQITYSLYEDTAWHYQVASDGNGGLVITNSPEVTEVNVRKDWADGASGDSATVELYCDGQATGKILTLTEDNGWSGSFDNLLKTDKDGKAHTYTVVELANNYNVNYSTADDGTLVVTNGPSKETVNVPVDKRWVDSAQGTSATIELVSNGEKTGKTVTLTEDNGWKGSFDDLPKYDSRGQKITYTVVEDTAVWNYTVTKNDDGSFTVANGPSTQFVSVPVHKEWANGASGKFATIELLANGEHTGKTVTLTEGNDWSASFDDLPKYDNQGNEISYTVAEQTSDWLYTVTPDGNGGYVVTNYPKPSKPDSPTNTPSTGDVSSLAGAGMLALAGMGSLLAGLRRRNKK
jgi:pilin isopeptide linkage protein/TQXA domain-containing protein